MTPEKIRAAERRDKAWRMRIAGATVSEIGVALGISKQSASRMLRNLAEQHARLNRQTNEQHLAVRNAQIELMIGVLQKRAYKDINEPDVAAVDRILKAMELHAKLNGYAAPIKAQIDVRALHAHVGTVVDSIVRLVPDERVGDVIRVLEDFKRSTEDAKGPFDAGLDSDDEDPGAGEDDDDDAEEAS